MKDNTRVTRPPRTATRLMSLCYGGTRTVVIATIVFAAALACWSSSALAWENIETSSAVGVTATGTTLTAKFYYETEKAKQYFFEYGTSTSYGSSTPVQEITGEGEVSVRAARITGLTPGVTYHYRVVIKGTPNADGSDRSFTTGTPTLQAGTGSGAFPISFTPAAGKVLLETADGEQVTCKSMTGSGSFTGAKEGHATLKLKECTSGLSTKCSNAGPEEIDTTELKSLLAYTYPAKTTAEGRETALVLSPASGEVLDEFVCENKAKTLKFKRTVKGSLIAAISPLGATTKTLPLAIKQTKANQELAEYETEAGGHVAAGLKCAINTEPGESCGAEATTPTLTLSSEEAQVEGASVPPTLRPEAGLSAFPVAFTPHGEGGGLVIEKHNGERIDCVGVTGSGKFTTAKEGRTTLALTECTTLPGKMKCANVSTGEVETKELQGLLEYTYPEVVANSGRQLGLVLRPETGEVFAEFVCENKAKTLKENFLIKGAVIGTTGGDQEEIPGFLKAMTLNLHQKAGAQEVTAYETSGGSRVATGLTCTIASEPKEECGIEESASGETLGGLQLQYTSEYARTEE